MREELTLLPIFHKICRILKILAILYLTNLGKALRQFTVSHFPPRYIKRIFFKVKILYTFLNRFFNGCKLLRCSIIAHLDFIHIL